MPSFRFDVNRDSGGVMLWMETPHGLNPIIGWADLEGVKEFAMMLLGFYGDRKDERDKTEDISENLLRQALVDGESFGEEFF